MLFPLVSPCHLIWRILTLLLSTNVGEDQLTGTAFLSVALGARFFPQHLLTVVCVFWIIKNAARLPSPGPRLRRCKATVTVVTGPNFTVEGRSYFFSEEHWNRIANLPQCFPPCA